MRTLAIVFGMTCFVSIAPAMTEEASHHFFTTSDGVRIHYMEMGAGPPVILIHGYTANAEWKWVKPGIAAALAERHRVIAMDARGHGQSDKPHDPMMYGPKMARDVIELMDELNISRAHVHGYSMGGSILTGVLARQPERVISAIYGGSGVRETDPAWQARVPTDPEPPESGAPNASRGERWSEYPGFDRTALDAVRGYPWTDEQRAIDLTGIEIPVLAIVGEFDKPHERTHRMRRELKIFRLVTLPGDTHGSAHFNPMYTEALVDFLNAQE